MVICEISINLRNMLISTDQSQRVSQPVSQITLLQLRISQITRSLDGTWLKCSHKKLELE